MKIEKARTLKPGDVVTCPPDRGEKGYTGKVESVGTAESITVDGTPYIWVTVRRPGAHASVWPSNRLG